MKKTPPPSEENARFTSLLSRLVAIPKEEVAQKEAEYRAEREQERVRPGRKKKRPEVTGSS